MRGCVDPRLGRRRETLQASAVRMIETRKWASCPSRNRRRRHWPRRVPDLRESRLEIMRDDQHGGHAERLRHGEIAGEVLEHRRVRAGHPIGGLEQVVGFGRRLGIQPGSDDVEDIIEVVEDAELPRRLLGMAAIAVGEDGLASGNWRIAAPSTGSGFSQE